MTGHYWRFQEVPLRRLEPERGRGSEHRSIRSRYVLIVNCYNGQDTSPPDAPTQNATTKSRRTHEECT